MPEIAITIDTWLCQRPRFMPDNTPIPMPTITDHRMANTVSSSVGVIAHPGVAGSGPGFFVAST